MPEEPSRQQEEGLKIKYIFQEKCFREYDAVLLTMPLFESSSETCSIKFLN